MKSKISWEDQQKKLDDQKHQNTKTPKHQNIFPFKEPCYIWKDMDPRILHASTVGRIFSGVHPDSPRNPRLAEFSTSIPCTLPPYIVKALPRKGWLLLSDDRTCTFVTVDDSHAFVRSRAVDRWCDGYDVAYFACIDAGGRVLFLDAPSLTTRLRWMWHHIIFSSAKRKLRKKYFSPTRTPARPVQKLGPVVCVSGSLALINKSVKTI